MTLYPTLILDALRGVRYPGNGKSLAENNMIEDDIRIDGNKVSFSLIFPKSTDPFIKSVVRTAETAIQQALGPQVEIKGNISVKTPPAPVQVEKPLLPGVRNIIGVSSGKGGVGKSTVAANLAVALARKGYKVGLLDADIFGPSVPKLFGVEDASLFMESVDGRDLIEPVEKYGVKLLSIGFLVDKDSPVLWRGSMASNALRQLIGEAHWGELDYFLIDMPPGTSDIHLTLVQTLPITGVIVVSTPQEVALADARKGIEMFRQEKINVPVLGLVENMAWFTPLPHPDERYYIFGNGGGVRMCEAIGVELLAQIPLVADLCTASDAGRPVTAAADEASAPIPSCEYSDTPQAIDNATTVNPEVTAFLGLADRVVTAIDKRNATLPPTTKVEVH